MNVSFENNTLPISLINIIVLEEGRVLESGNHDELMQKAKGRFRKMWNEQA